MNERLEGLKNMSRKDIRINRIDIAWLIQQAERVQELEDEIKSHAPYGRNYTNQQYVKLLQQNKRYRQALEKARNDLLVGDIENGAANAFRVITKALEDKS